MPCSDCANIVPEELCPLVNAIADARKADEMNASLSSSGIAFARFCFGCHQISPPLRSLAVACGHLVCRQCGDAAVNCPQCYVDTEFVLFYEDENHSRECGICLCASPIDRVGLTACGHSLCLPCNTEMWMEAMERGAQPTCPHCRTPSDGIILDECVPKSALPLPRSDLLEMVGLLVQPGDSVEKNVE